MDTATVALIVALLAVLGNALNAGLTHYRERERRRKDLLLDAYHTWAIAAMDALEHVRKRCELICKIVRVNREQADDLHPDFTEVNEEMAASDKEHNMIRKTLSDGAIKINLLEGNRKRMARLETLSKRVDANIPAMMHLTDSSDTVVAQEEIHKAMTRINELSSNISNHLEELAKVKYFI